MRASILGLLLLCAPVTALAQATLEDGYRAMYNLQFDEAHRIFGAWQQAHPDDAFAAVSDAAAYLFTEFDRLHILEMEFFLDDSEWAQKPAADPQLKAKFEQALTKGERLADAALARSPKDKEALFAKAMAQGLRSDYMRREETGTGSIIIVHSAGESSGRGDSYLTQRAFSLGGLDTV